MRSWHGRGSYIYNALIGLPTMVLTPRRLEGLPKSLPPWQSQPEKALQTSRRALPEPSLDFLH